MMYFRVFLVSQEFLATVTQSHLARSEKRCALSATRETSPCVWALARLLLSTPTVPHVVCETLS